MAENVYQSWQYVAIKTGGYTLVSDADTPSLEGRTLCSQWQMNGTDRKGRVYVYFREPGSDKRIWLHRFLLGVDERFTFVDHINGNGLDNRRENLRTCTPKENSVNSQNRSGSSIYRGVGWSKQSDKWLARISNDGRLIHIGLFDEEEDAARAYDAAAQRLHGSFARLNFAQEVRS